MRQAALLYLLCLLTACAPSRTDESGTPGVIRLTYWSAPNAQEQELARTLVERWNAAHPDVQVTVQPLPAGQSSEEVLLAAVVAGTTPDVCSNIWPGILADLTRAGGVLALDTLAGFDAAVRDRVPPDLLASFRAPDGHVYQIPWKTNPIMMLYNRGLFREAGFEAPPRTYGDYLRAAALLTRDRDGDGHVDQWMGYRDIRPIWWQRYFDFYPFYIGASGGRTLFDDGEVSVDAAAATAVFDFFRAVYAGGYFPITTFQGSPFVARRIATEFTGPWSIAWLEENAPPDLDYGYAPLPVPDHHAGPAYTYGDYKNIAVFATTKHPEAAWAFARYLVSEEADRLLLELTRQIPVRDGLLTDAAFADFFAAHPNVRPFAAQAVHTRGVDGVSSLQEILDAIAQQFEAAAVYRARPPADATAEALERIHLIHEWSR